MEPTTIEECETSVQCSNCGNPYYKCSLGGFGNLYCKTCNYEITDMALLHGVKVTRD